MSKSSYVDNLRFTRIDILNKLIIAHLNINSIINKFDLLVDKIKENIEILMISETKLDNSFPTIPFLIKGFNYTIRQDRNLQRLFLLTFWTDRFYVEINLHNKNWLLSCSHNPEESSIKHHLRALSTSSDICSSQFGHFVLSDDFNVEI